jgi:uncharacterized membrane protein YhaH (DUF805 family)
MDLAALFFSAYGRILPKPVTLAVAAVYALAFVSQLLLSPPVLGHFGWLPFALVQAIATWAWFCLHAKRLREADRSSGPVVAIAILYALAMVLLLLVVMLLAVAMPDDATRKPSAGLADFLVVAILIRVLAGDPRPGLFGFVAIGILVLILVPIIMAVGFSIWTGTRPSVSKPSAMPP